MKKTLIIIACILIFSGGGYIAAEKKYEVPTFHSTTFVTVVSADKNSSVADKEVSSQGLSETIIGWTHSPLFSQKMGFHISGKKQERQNIILEFDTEHSVDSKEMAQQNTQLKSVLIQKLSDYNTLSKTEFALLFEEAVISENIPKKSMWILAGAILGLFIGASLSEIFIKNRARNRQNKNKK